MARLRIVIPLLLLLVWVALGVARPSPRAAVLAEDARPLAGTPGLAATDAPRSIDELRERIAEVLVREGVPGAGIALVDREGIVWAGGVGVADRESGAPVTEHTVFRVASITKSIVGLGVARLAAQGRLSLDAPLRHTLPELELQGPWADELTLAHVLEHTAGFDDMRFNEWWTEDEGLAPALALQINPRSRAIRWRPGSRMAYSNVGYTVAGLAIERATGEPFDQWLRAEVFAPLGMGEATFRRTPERSEQLATGYLDRERPARFSPIAHRPAGALLATPVELGQLVRFWLRRGEGLPAVVPPAWLDRIERADSLRRSPLDVDYGLGNYGDVAHPVRARGHDGGLPGFLSCYRYFPELGVGYVMLLNATHSALAYAEIRRLLFAYLTRDLRLPRPPRVEPGSERESWAGSYALANPRNELLGFLDRAVVSFELGPTPDGIWLRSSFGLHTEAVATVDGAYRFPRESGSSIRLVRDDDGARVLTAGWVYAQEQSPWRAKLRWWLLTAAVLLLQLAPPLAAIWLLIRGVRRRGLRHAGLWLWPGLAGLMLGLMPFLLAEAAARDALGRVDPTTVGLCAATIVFALGSAFGFAAAVRAAVARDRPSWIARLVPTLTSTLALGLTLWLGAHGIIGLRTWAW
ncbi:MAG: beta-lactamase family protein [Myxococcales bacterium]|nr:beta-lactamase family protein [Myxococcales bacterium]